MTYFQYKVLESDGQETMGVIESPTMEQAATALREQGQFIVSIKQTKSPQVASTINQRRWVYRAAWFMPILARDRAMFFRQLAMMIQTGLTLLQALQVCQKESNKKALRAVIARVILDIEEGSTFSMALKHHHRIFSGVVVQMIESAEASGELNVAMNRIAENIERRSEQILKLISALFYPIFVLFVAMAVTLFLVYGVIPKFAQFIEAKGGNLPASTQFLMDLSKGAIAYLPVILITLSALLLTLYFTYKTTKGRAYIHRRLLDIPVVGGTLTYAAISQFGYILSNLLESGLTLVDSLRIAGRAISNQAIQTHILKAREEIIDGNNLATAMEDIIIPPTVSQVIAIGEQTGNLGDVLLEIGKYYDERLQARIRWLSAITEPVLIIIVGSIVGFVYFSFFMAAINMTAGG